MPPQHGVGWEGRILGILYCIVSYRIVWYCIVFCLLDLSIGSAYWIWCSGAQVRRYSTVPDSCRIPMAMVPQHHKFPL